ncbi:sugar transferase [Vibrio paucivorans]
MLRLDYSRTTLILGLGLSFFWFSIFRFLYSRRLKAKLFYLSNVCVEQFEQYESLDLKPISHDTQIKEVGHGVLVNLHKPLTREEEHFLADCSLSNIPIYHSHLLREKLDKKVSTTHLTQNTIEVLSPNIGYLKIRSIVEKLLIIGLAPIILPLLLITATIVKINLPSESILYRQERVGRNASRFIIYKFRTMESKEGDEAKFATSEHQRISWVGRWLRQSRLDELPQLLNVLKDEMSLIGPRPEQLFFVEQYQQEIPFYNYRHIVKPGITGWAQIEQGYTDSIQSTKDKLSYDLYYIKHLSLELDVYIAIKTLKIILLRKGE